MVTCNLSSQSIHISIYRHQYYFNSHINLPLFAHVVKCTFVIARLVCQCLCLWSYFGRPFDHYLYFHNWQTSWALFVCMGICTSIIGRPVRHSCIFLTCGFSILDRLFWLLFRPKKKYVCLRSPDLP
jgi:hypothetical protein